ncbi:hypothetical protein TL16_g12565 [Triparma laevis f. inornata]|uniref:Uncharacterized protein n=1 Tax=Triparma laevis f. inornata TaxID=1714386 RepID=A0A9W7EWU8_9STRA|nr:hypothetical protein TL16_g12565 [Triparma laevis f. inornata]
MTNHQVAPDLPQQVKYSFTTKFFKVKQKYMSFANLVLYFSACLSFIDLLFDIIMVHEYNKSNQKTFANATAALIRVSIGLQLIVAFASHSKQGTFVVLREMLYVVTLVKPATIIQVMAVVAGQQSTVAFLSLISSVLTAAFISTSISIEEDVSKECRKHAPHFYGLVPLESILKSVTVCFLVLFTCTCQLSAKGE